MLNYRCSTNEVYGVLPVHILAEVMHVLMLAEAKDLGLVKGANPARQLCENPWKIRVLKRYESLIRDLLAIGIAAKGRFRNCYAPSERTWFINK